MAFFAGLPAVIPFLIGGAFGGALPDIDVEGSAVSTMGSKATRSAGKMASKMGGRAGKAAKGIFSAVGLALDSIILKPICRAWRWIAEHFFGKVYFAIYNIGGGNGGTPLGKKLHWDGSSPWAHRGGLTHSFTFLLNSSIVTGPIALLVGGLPFWLGCEIGILSHLLADAICRSGVKFFWPFIIPIGFGDRNGGKVGDGIRLLPFSLLVSTGAAQKSREEINALPDTEKAEARILKRREIMWQWIFKLGALAMLALLFFGIGPAHGGLAWSFDESSYFNPLTKVQTSQPQQQNQNTGTGNANSQGQNQDQNQAQDQNQPQADPSIAAAGSVAGVNPQGDMNADAGQSVPEKAGPKSLTYGDLPIDKLPRGVIKLPDESLWIIGVGPVNEANLNNPRWAFTDSEKRELLMAATAQRLDEIPDSASQAASDAANAASNAANQAANTQEDEGIVGWIKDLLGINGDQSAYDGGFLGITPYTQSK